ncbi:related to pisatin demethylase cytochrome P450 [Phialocephala subalpina]|uniref:Related to pisatin demethylase cytochrome P450 n=1 Tax=Phialocephala subalpina TaxID=576137 RepID=A0A1L7X5F5_9HELO|nr:related to pisatin demethylase cytochrome P450 [Phialocephala subalpina]
MAPDEASIAPTLVITGVASGAALHQIVKRIELDRHPLSFLGAFIGSILGLALILQNFSAQYENYGSAFKAAWFTILRTVVSLWVNILVHRAFFHPLNNFPGPFGAKLSKFWALGEVVKSKVKWYQVTGRLQEQYGDYVRTGPRELMIYNAEAIKPLLGPSSKARKGPFYNGLQQSIHTTRDHDFHKKRRKIWDMAFKQSLSDYGSIIEEFTDTLLAGFEASKGNPIAINDLCIYYSWDVMSSVGFNSSTEFLTGKSVEFATKILNGVQDGFSAIEALLHVPWMLTVIESISFAGPMLEFNTWAADQVEARRNMKTPRPDIMGHLLAETEDTAAGNKLLNADSRVIIGAGRQALLIINLLAVTDQSVHDSYQKKLREEIDISFQEKTYNCAKPEPLLDGIISEALRLFPPVTFGSQRVIPEPGMTIGDVDIPPDTVVSLAMYQIQRDLRNYVQPEAFIPERWTTQPSLILDKDAFMPFSIGPYNCAGRSLAMMELRSVVARTVYRYDISLVEGDKFDENVFFAGVKDHFTLGIPKIDLVFIERGS